MPYNKQGQAKKNMQQDGTDPYELTLKNIKSHEPQWHGIFMQRRMIMSAL